MWSRVDTIPLSQETLERALRLLSSAPAESGITPLNFPIADNDETEQLLADAVFRNREELFSQLRPAINEQGELKLLFGRSHSRYFSQWDGIFYVRTAHFTFADKQRQLALIFSHYAVKPMSQTISESLKTESAYRLAIAGYDGNKAWPLDEKARIAAWLSISDLLAAVYYTVRREEDAHLPAATRQIVYLRLYEGDIGSRLIKINKALYEPDTPPIFDDSWEPPPNEFYDTPGETVEAFAVEKALVTGDEDIAVYWDDEFLSSYHAEISEDDAAHFARPFYDTKGIMRLPSWCSRYTIGGKPIDYIDQRIIGADAMVPGGVILVITPHLAGRRLADAVFFCSKDGERLRPLTAAEQESLAVFINRPKEVQKAITTLRELKELL